MNELFYAWHPLALAGLYWRVSVMKTSVSPAYQVETLLSDA
jgi:hypothetical protein